MQTKTTTEKIKKVITDMPKKERKWYQVKCTKPQKGEKKWKAKRETMNKDK